MRKRSSNLSGKRIIVTGAGRGIGAATAIELAARGARVALVGRTASYLHDVAATIGPTSIVLPADISDLGALQAAAAATVEQFGGIDAVVANAGIAGYGSIATIEPETFAQVLDTNLVGSFNTARAVLPALRASGGYFLSVASVASFAPGAGFASYCASKAGLEAMIDAFALEARRDGVAVGIAHPSWIDTDMLRDSDRDLPAFAEGRDMLPWPCNSVHDSPTCARFLADAVGRRARKVYLPQSVMIVRWARPILSGRAAALLAGRKVDRTIRGIEEQHVQLGRSVSDRVLTPTAGADAANAADVTR